MSWCGSSSQAPRRRLADLDGVLGYEDDQRAAGYYASSDDDDAENYFNRDAAAAAALSRESDETISDLLDDATATTSDFGNRGEKKKEEKNAELDQSTDDDDDDGVPTAERPNNNTLVYHPTPLAFAIPNVRLSSVSTVASDRMDDDDINIAEAAAAGADPSVAPAEPVVVQQQAAARPPPPAQRRHDPNGYYPCADPACGRWFSTPQALGGHRTSAHKNKTGAAAGRITRQDSKDKEEEKLYRCDECPAVFASGVQLGGHKRKHWDGKSTATTTRKNKKLVRQQQLALPPPLGGPAPADHVPSSVVDDAAADGTPDPEPATTTATATGPRVTGGRRVMLFGVDIGRDGDQQQLPY